MSDPQPLSIEPQFLPALAQLMEAVHPQTPGVPPPPHVVPDGQGVHDVPHVASLVLSAQTEPHAWKPLLQAMPQLVPSHVALPFVGTAHAEQLDVPQCAVLLFVTHDPLQLWKPEEHG